MKEGTTEKYDVDAKHTVTHVIRIERTISYHDRLLTRDIRRVVIG